MKTSDVDLILGAIGDLRESNKESHEAIRENLKSGIRGLQIKIETDDSLIERSIRELDNTVKRQNSRIEKVENKIDEFKKPINTLVYLRKKWVLISLALLLIFTILSFLYDIGMITKLFNLIIKKL